MKNEINFPSISHYEKLPEQSLNMKDDEMEKILLSIYDTDIWFAIRRYSEKRACIAEQMLQVNDPFKNPTDACRYQGIRQGVLDLQDYIISLRNKKE